MTKAKAGAAKEAGFSLLELLVVLGIAAVATALALPRVQGTAARSTLEGNARRLVSVLQLAHAEMATHIGHEFNHHHAQSDAEAAGRVLLAMMKHTNANTPRELLQKTGLEPKRFCQ